MKFISFNINSIRARLHQLKAIIAVHQPDFIGLQETKVHDDAFPLKPLEDLGYHLYYHGQKSHYGVAIMTKLEPVAIRKGFPGDAPDSQRRLIMADITTPQGLLTIINGYFPQGENRTHPIKFPAKEKFYTDLMHYLSVHHTPNDLILIMGDMNISPEDTDIGIGEINKQRWLKTGQCSFLPEERSWLAKLFDWGFSDTFRVINPLVTDQYSWFDYRSKGFDDNRGLRIDLLLATPALTQKCSASGIDYQLRAMEKPSDHAPIWSEFNLD